MNDLLPYLLVPEVILERILTETRSVALADNLSENFEYPSHLRNRNSSDI